MCVGKLVRSARRPPVLPENGHYNMGMSPPPHPCNMAPISCHSVAHVGFYVIYILCAGTYATELAPDTFDKLANGKFTFVMFRAPWCGHCKAMKPAWDQLEQEFVDSKAVLVGHVDCTAHSKFCGGFAIKGYPTLRYGHPQDLEEYKGGRSIEELRKFAEGHLGPTCGPGDVDSCDEAQKKVLQEWMGMPRRDIDIKIKSHEDSIEEA